MAVTLGSAFVNGTALAGGGDFAFVEPRRCKRTHFRISAEGASTATRGSEDNLSKRGRGEEISSMLENGVEKPRALWWAPLFQVSAEEQWENVLGDSGTTKGSGQKQFAPAPAAVPSAAVSLPEVIEAASAEKGSRRQAAKVAFTAEKARALRKSMRGTETWHDGWYHSAIASRLAEE